VRDAADSPIHAAHPIGFRPSVKRIFCLVMYTVTY